MEINNRIEHTLLNPKANWRDLRKLCEEAKKYNFRSVCINPEWVHFAKEKLAGTDVKVVQVYNFPTSRSTLLVGDEVDVFLKLNSISKSIKTRSKGKKVMEETIKFIEKSGIDRSRIKFIIETKVISAKDIVVASRILTKLRVGYIKSSTGLFIRENERTNLDHLKLIKKGTMILGFIPRRIFRLYTPKIKIAGGVRTTADAKTLIRNGSDLLGTSAGIKIMDGDKK